MMTERKPPNKPRNATGRTGAVISEKDLSSLIREMKAEGIYKVRDGRQKTIALPDSAAAYYSRYTDSDGRILLIPVSQ